MPAKKLTFEQSMARLDEIVAALDRAEQKVQKLLRGPDGEVVSAPMEGMEL